MRRGMKYVVPLVLLAPVTACEPGGSEHQLDETALVEEGSPATAMNEEQIFNQFSLAKQLPNNFPILNGVGLSGTYSTQGAVSLSNEFHTPQGTNGRDCSTCHLASASWSVRPSQIAFMFLTTEGTHPIFNPLDADNPNVDLSTPEARWAGYSMLRRGLFRRGGAPPATREFDVIAADDPAGFGTTARPAFFRRPLPTMNFQHSVGAMWDDRLTVPGDMHAALISQARGNVTGAQQGAAPTAELLEAIVGYEESLSTAQMALFGVGRLDVCGGRGGPENLSAQPLVAGPFDLYSAWSGLRPGACGPKAADKKRAQIARGQELFNTAQNANGRTCQGCHNAANGGTNVNGTLFNIGTSSAAFRKPYMPIYTLKNRTTGEEMMTTDPGKGWVTGKWSDLNRFKVPTLRGLAGRAPYFHNGLAASLEEVVHFYEQSLGFDFTPEQEADLVAFMNAL